MKNFLQNRWLWFTLRLLIAGIFLFTAVFKIADINGFIDLVIGYGLLPDGPSRLVGWVVPWVELYIGCALILGVFVRLTQVIVIPLMVVFGIVNIYAIVSDSVIMCGCLGSFLSLPHPVSLTLNCIILVFSLVLITQKEKDFLILGRVFDRIKPDFRAKRRLCFNVSLVASVVLVMAVVTGIIFVLVRALHVHGEHL